MRVGQVVLVKAGPFLLVLALWQLLPQLGLIKPLFLPALSVVIKTLIEITLSGKLGQNFIATLYRIAIGLGLGASAAIIVGLIIGLSRPLRQFTMPLVAASYPLPKIAMLSLFLVWFGLGDPPIIAILSLSAFYPMLLNTLTGVLTVDDTLIKAAYNMGANYRQVLTKVVLPGALPVIFGGFRIAASVSLLVVVAVEMYIANNGIGYLLAWATQWYKMDLLYANIIVIGLFGILLFKLIQFAEKKIVPWKEKMVEG